MVVSGHNQLFPVPHICVRILELIAGFLVIVAIRHLTNHNNESCIWQLWEVTSCLFAKAQTQICHWSLVASHSLFPRLPNVTCTFREKNLNPLSLNPFRIIKTFQRQPVLQCLQKICNHHLPVQGSISHMFQTVVSPDNGPMLLLQNRSHPCFSPLVDDTKVGVADPVGKSRQGEFHLLQPDCGFPSGNALVQQAVAPIFCIEFVIRNLWSLGQICNPCNICPARFRSRLESFCSGADRGSARSAMKLSLCSSGPRCRPNDRIVPSRCWRHSWCAWRWRPMSCEFLREGH